MVDPFPRYLLLAARAQIEIAAKGHVLVQEQVRHSLKIIARSQAQIERLNAHLANLDPGAGLGRPKA